MPGIKLDGYGLNSSEVAAIQDLVNAIAPGAGASTLSALTDVASFNLPATNTALIAALAAKQAALVSGSNLRTVNGSTLLGNTDLIIAAGGLSAVEDVAGTTYAVVAGDLNKVKRLTNAAGCVVTVPTGLGATFNCVFTKSAAAGPTTYVGGATLVTENGSLVMNTVSGSVQIIPIAVDVYNLSGSFGPLIPSTIDLNGTDKTVSFNLAAADFGTGIVRLNHATVAIAVTVPLVATMALAATPGKVRRIIFQNAGASIATFAGASGVTLIGNSGAVVAGAAVPIGGVPVLGDYITLVQSAVGADSWNLG